MESESRDAEESDARPDAVTAEPSNDPGSTGSSPPSRLQRELMEAHDLASGVIGESVEGQAGALGRILQFDRDIDEWLTALTGRPEIAQLVEARAELGFATYAAASGLYRLAYSASRLFLELSFAAVHFSANELHRRKWLADRADFSWSTALDPDQGLLTTQFVREFNADAAGDAKAFSLKASDAYRHCSQFIHGKHAVTKRLPRSVSYSEAVLADWASTTALAAESVLYLLYCRYGADLLETDHGRLGATLEHHFGHLKSVRIVLGLPVEEE